MHNLQISNIVAPILLRALMPRANPKNCATSGCTQSTYGRWCEAHRKESYKVKSLNYDKEYKKWYSTKAWRNTRADVLALEPMCRTCSAMGINNVATDVDHVIPHEGNDSLFWDRANMQPLCHRCHSSKTMHETRAKKEGTYHAS